MAITSRIAGTPTSKDQVEQRFDSDGRQEREHGTEEKDDGDNRPFRPGPKVTHRWTIAGLLTGAIVQRRPSKTRWPQAREGAESCRRLRGARARRSRRDGEGNVGIGEGVRFSGLGAPSQSRKRSNHRGGRQSGRRSRPICREARMRRSCPYRPPVQSSCG